MPVIIATKNGETLFSDKNLITVGSHPNCDVLLKVPVKFVLSVEIIPTGGYKIMNRFSSPEVLFRGQPMGSSLSVEKACKLMIAGTDEFIGIKTPVSQEQPASQQVPAKAVVKSAQRPVRKAPAQPQVTMTAIAEQDFDEDDIRELYGDKINASTKIKLDKRKADIEQRRVSIIKEIAFVLSDSKKKMAANGNAEKFLFLALIACPVIMSSAVSDTLAKMVMDTNVNTFFPLHMRLLAGYAILLFVNALILKQGVFLHLQEKLKERNAQKTGAVAKTFMLLLSSVIFFVVGIVILVFYFDPTTALEQGQTIVSIISLFTLILCSICSGYFKSTANEAAIQYDKYENREDFKKVLQDYQQWIGLYINNLSSVKLKNLRDKQFAKSIKSWGEYILGIATAPFLAYGVSITLASCFPDAAGIITLASGFKVSVVFLVLATVMICFAFFALTSYFVSIKQVNGADVIKNDGFNNYIQHGVDLFGTEAVKKIKSDGLKCLIIALSIIFIEFTMNVSYFMKENGSNEWSSIFLSIICALVPTALLVAETLLLSHTMYEIHTYDEILSRLDKEID